MLLLLMILESVGACYNLFSDIVFESDLQGRNADALALYFGEDPTRCPFEQGISHSNQEISSHVHRVDLRVPKQVSINKLPYSFMLFRNIPTHTASLAAVAWTFLLALQHISRILLSVSQTALVHIFIYNTWFLLFILQSSQHSSTSSKCSCAPTKRTANNWRWRRKRRRKKQKMKSWRSTIQRTSHRIYHPQPEMPKPHRLARILLFHMQGSFLTYIRIQQRETSRVDTNNSRARSCEKKRSSLRKL